MVSGIGAGNAFVVRAGFAMLWGFFVTARAPVPPAAFGLPTPSRVCAVYDLRVRGAPDAGWASAGIVFPFGGWVDGADGSAVGASLLLS